MLVEMGVKDFGKVRHLFKGHKQYIPSLAVIENHFPGRVFVDSIKNPGIAIVWALGRWAYIEGNHRYHKLAPSLPDLISHTIIPDSLSMSVNWFELYAWNSQEWTERLDECLHVFNYNVHYESVYILDVSAYIRFRSRYSYPNDVVVELDDIPILPEHISDTRFISNKFRRCTAIGCKAKVNDRAVALCRSNGFALGDEFMIDVATFDRNLRGKGYATAAAAGLLDYCIERRLAPLWETTQDNVASRRLAQKLGFVEDETYPVYAIEF